MMLWEHEGAMSWILVGVRTDRRCGYRCAKQRTQGGPERILASRTREWDSLNTDKQVQIGEQRGRASVDCVSRKVVEKQCTGRGYKFLMSLRPAVSGCCHSWVT